ncbi:argininosuccinate synthase, partial [Streptococcus agalactiae]|nr:argininosuccinate synthase [Streptococcus agalactiae]
MPSPLSFRCSRCVRCAFLFSPLSRPLRCLPPSPLVSALRRPLLAPLRCPGLPRCAPLAPGCPGPGPAPVRFAVALAALAPAFPVLAPVRAWAWPRAAALPFCPAPASLFPPLSLPFFSRPPFWPCPACGVLAPPWPPAPAPLLVFPPPPPPLLLVPPLLLFRSPGPPLALPSRPAPRRFAFLAPCPCRPPGLGRLAPVAPRFVGLPPVPFLPVLRPWSCSLLLPPLPLSPSSVPCLLFPLSLPLPSPSSFSCFLVSSRSPALLACPRPPPVVPGPPPFRSLRFCPVVARPSSPSFSAAPFRLLPLLLPLLPLPPLVFSPLGLPPPFLPRPPRSLPAAPRLPPSSVLGWSFCPSSCPWVAAFGASLRFAPRSLPLLCRLLWPLSPCSAPGSSSSAAAGLLPLVSPSARSLPPGPLPFRLSLPPFLCPSRASSPLPLAPSPVRFLLPVPALLPWLPLCPFFARSLARPAAALASFRPPFVPFAALLSLLFCPALPLSPCSAAFLWPSSLASSPLFSRAPARFAFPLPPSPPSAPPLSPGPLSSCPPSAPRFFAFAPLSSFACCCLPLVPFSSPFSPLLAFSCCLSPVFVPPSFLGAVLPLPSSPSPLLSLPAPLFCLPRPSCSGRLPSRAARPCFWPFFRFLLFCPPCRSLLPPLSPPLPPGCLLASPPSASLLPPGSSACAPACACAPPAALPGACFFPCPAFAASFPVRGSLFRPAPALVGPLVFACRPPWFFFPALLSPLLPPFPRCSPRSLCALHCPARRSPPPFLRRPGFAPVPAPLLLARPPCPRPACFLPPLVSLCSVSPVFSVPPRLFLALCSPSPVRGPAPPPSAACLLALVSAAPSSPPLVLPALPSVASPPPLAWPPALLRAAAAPPAPVLSPLPWVRLPPWVVPPLSPLLAPLVASLGLPVPLLSPLPPVLPLLPLRVLPSVPFPSVCWFPLPVAAPCPRPRRCCSRPCSRSFRRRCRWSSRGCRRWSCRSRCLRPLAAAPALVAPGLAFLAAGLGPLPGPSPPPGPALPLLPCRPCLPLFLVSPRVPRWFRSSCCSPPRSPPWCCSRSRSPACPSLSVPPLVPPLLPSPLPPLPPCRPPSLPPVPSCPWFRCPSRRRCRPSCRVWFRPPASFPPPLLVPAPFWCAFFCFSAFFFPRSSFPLALLPLLSPPCRCLCAFVALLLASCPRPSFSLPPLPSSLALPGPPFGLLAGRSGRPPGPPSPRSPAAARCGRAPLPRLFFPPRPCARLFRRFFSLFSFFSFSSCSRWLSFSRSLPPRAPLGVPLLSSLLPALLGSPCRRCPRPLFLRAVSPPVPVPLPRAFGPCVSSCSRWCWPPGFVRPSGSLSPPLLFPFGSRRRLLSWSLVVPPRASLLCSSVVPSPLRLPSPPPPLPPRPRRFPPLFACSVAFARASCP